MADATARYEALIALAAGRLPARGLHKHRIVPGYQGGEYVDGNVLRLTRVEHIEIHRLRYELFGDHRDLLACKLLGDKLSDEEWLTCAKAGGRAAGAMNAKSRIGVTARSKEKMSADGRKARAARDPEEAARWGQRLGNAFGPRLKEQRRGIFGIPAEQDRLNRQKGGAIQGRRLSYEQRTRGMRGTKWATNGASNLRLMPGLPLPDGYRFGKSNYHLANT